VPKYYFHYRTDDELVEDREGSVHSDLEAAHAHAADLGRALLSMELRRGEDPGLPRSIEITDEEGNDQLYVVFWASLTARDTGNAKDKLATPTLH